MIKSLNPGAQRKAWFAAWGELIRRRLIIKMHRQARFKIFVVIDQTEDGVLTESTGEPTDPDYTVWGKNNDSELKD